ncbi:MAG: hypothetical protein IIA09_00865 [Proteobacteria bacterium]|nr:hypothetical protein [Pseudomonadota bacterium]
MKLNLAGLVIGSTLLCGALTTASAHHSVLHYDGKKEVTISGVVTKARYGYPHSIYRIEVTAEDGSTEEWVLSTEDPRDAKRLGFDEEIKNLKAGDEITVVGWPHQFIERELRGHELHYPDGRVVMMRTGNYIWPKDILRLDRFVMNPQNITEFIDDIDATLPAAEQLTLWIAEDDHIARVAYEVSQDRPRLIGITMDGSTEFPGVDELLYCHTTRDEFTFSLVMDQLDEDTGAIIADSGEYISEYNRVLSRWWEQERSSCH